MNREGNSELRHSDMMNRMQGPNENSDAKHIYTAIGEKTDGSLGDII